MTCGYHRQGILWYGSGSYIQFERITSQIVQSIDWLSLPSFWVGPIGSPVLSILDSASRSSPTKLLRATFLRLVATSRSLFIILLHLSGLLNVPSDGSLHCLPVKPPLLDVTITPGRWSEEWTVSWTCASQNQSKVSTFTSTLQIHTRTHVPESMSGNQFVGHSFSFYN